MVREGTVSNVWTGNWKRGEIVKFIAEDQGRESCYSFVTMVSLRCDRVRVEAISQWTAETLVTPRDSCQERDKERDNQQEFSLRLPHLLQISTHGPCLARTKSCAVFYSRFHISQCVTHRSDHQDT